MRTTPWSTKHRAYGQAPCYLLTCWKKLLRLQSLTTKTVSLAPGVDADPKDTFEPSSRLPSPWTWWVGDWKSRRKLVYSSLLWPRSHRGVYSINASMHGNHLSPWQQDLVRGKRTNGRQLVAYDCVRKKNNCVRITGTPRRELGLVWLPPPILEFLERTLPKKKSRIHGVLNEVYLQNLSRDEYNFSRWI